MISEIKTVVIVFLKQKCCIVNYDSLIATGSTDKNDQHF